MVVGGVLSSVACVALALVAKQPDDESLLHDFTAVFVLAAVVALLYSLVGRELRRGRRHARGWATALLILGLIPAFLVPIFFGNIVLLVMLVSDATAEHTAVLLD
jgi:hypothetical protein